MIDELVATILNGPYWLLPDEFAHDLVHRLGQTLPDQSRPRPGEHPRNTRARLRRFVQGLKNLHRIAAGRRSLHPSLRRNWP